ncbi:MAG: RluA family pseudouridine synthase [bacterium]|nr:RluA family pseudouridine synthase [bacterium]
MNDDLNLEVTRDALPQRIDKYLALAVALSRSRIQQLVEAGQVERNGRLVVRVSEKVGPGDRIRVVLPPPGPCEVPPEDLAFGILYQDAHLAVIDKPAGLSVHPTEHHKTGTLVNGLLYRIKDLSGIGGILRPGIVHRLDRVTSGVLVIAKTDQAHQVLSEAFKARQIKKMYQAIVHGVPLQERGEVDQPIGRHASDRKRMCVRADGRISKTIYKICRRGLGGSFVELYPYTGRTHQLRVHMNYLGCPIVGDPVYGYRKTKNRGELERVFQTYPGIALHAARLRFTHPCHGEVMTFEVPLPEIFHAVIEKMK